MNKHTLSSEQIPPRPNLSRRQCLAFIASGLLAAGCAPASQVPANTGQHASTPTVTALQRGALQPIHVRNAGHIKSLTTLTPEGVAVAWSPTGSVLAIGSAENAIQVWDVATLKQLRTLQGHSDRVNRIRWSPDGRLLASASDDGTVRLWDGQRDIPRAVLQGPFASNTVLSVAWSPDSRRLVAGYGNGAVEIWDAATNTGHALLGQQATDLRTKAVWGIAWSPDGKWIISPQYDGILHVWKTESGGLSRTLHADDLPNDVQWRPDGRTFASSSDKGTVQLWEPATFSNRTTLTISGNNGWVYPLAWSPDGRLLAGGYQTGLIQIWDAGTGTGIHTWQGHTDRVWDLAWSPDGRLIASASKDETVRLWGTT
ncbi:MAG: WD40 repeat domain-containing protein [Chloroflexota bacterium]|nr:WD40 repeat domain-containing protein [Chloroflexota bacterium]